MLCMCTGWYTTYTAVRFSVIIGPENEVSWFYILVAYIQLESAAIFFLGILWLLIMFRICCSSLCEL